MTTYLRDNDGKYIDQFVWLCCCFCSVRAKSLIWYCLFNDFCIAGKFIPSSQRPDGTWRKARRVKDGYVPQEEVPLYESKGKQFAKKPDLPVGLCPIVAQAAKAKRDKQLLKQAKAAAAATSAGNKSAPGGNHEKKKDKKGSSNEASNKSAGQQSKNIKPTNVKGLCEAVTQIDLNSEEDVLKQIKKLRKKIREIEAIEEKLKSGELKTPEQDQLDKVSRKSSILKQIAVLDALHD